MSATQLPLEPRSPTVRTHRQRLTEQLLTQGAQGLSDIDLLTVALGSAHLARSLPCSIDRWNALTAQHLLGLRRLKPARIARLLATLELGRRIPGTPMVRGEGLHCGEAVARAYRPRLWHLHQEVFIVVGLDARHRVLGEHEIARGSVTSVEVHPREVFRPLGKIMPTSLGAHPLAMPQKRTWLRRSA